MGSQISISRQAELLGLSKGALYYEAIPESELNLKLMDLIDRIYLEYPFYGSRKITATLERDGHEVNRKRIQRLMRLMGIVSIAPGPQTSKGVKEHKKYPYLLRGLVIERPNHVWSSDITYIRVRGGYAYLVAVIDWFSRLVLSWRFSNSLEGRFCIEALEEAFNRFGHPQIVNVDQGCQFTSENYVSAVLSRNLKISMDGVGRALDNIMVERLWRSVKYEEVYLKGYQEKTMKEAYDGIKSYFDFYNNKRPHQSLSNKTPNEVHRAI